jgi:hypothetical protein
MRTMSNAPDRQQGVSAASSSIDTGVTEPPVSLVALATFPETIVCRRLARVTEETAL